MRLIPNLVRVHGIYHCIRATHRTTMQLFGPFATKHVAALDKSRQSRNRRPSVRSLPGALPDVDLCSRAPLQCIAYRAAVPLDGVHLRSDSLRRGHGRRWLPFWELLPQFGSDAIFIEFLFG